MPLVHFFHVLFYSIYMLLSEFKWHQILLSLRGASVRGKFVISDCLVLKPFKRINGSGVTVRWTSLRLVLRHLSFRLRGWELLIFIALVEKAAVSFHEFYSVHLRVFRNRRHASWLVSRRLLRKWRGLAFFLPVVWDVVLVAHWSRKLFLAWFGRRH